MEDRSRGRSNTEPVGDQRQALPIVQIEEFNGCLLCDSLPPEIAPKLSTVRRVAIADDRHGYRLVRRQELLLQPNPSGPNAGLMAAVVHLLRQSRRAYTVLPRSSPRPVAIPAPDESPVRWRGPCDAQTLDFVRSHDRGLIRFDGRGAVDPAWLIAQIALAFPQANLAVLVGSAAAGFRLRQRIARWIRGVVTLTSRPDGRQTVGQVVIGTPGGLAHDAVEFNKREFVIVPRATDALHYWSRVALTTVSPRFRLFGLLADSQKLAPYERDQVRATFGFDEVSIPRHGFVPRPVRFVFSPVNGGPRLPFDAGLLDLKRIGIWRHPVRNRRVAQVADAISGASDDRLWQYCLPEAAPIIEGEPLHEVVVLVENIEHALALAERLPDWPLVTGEEVVQVGLSSHQRRLLADRQAQPNGAGQRITTAAGLLTMDLSDVDAIVWAGAGPGLPPVPAERLITRSDERGLLLVDFADRHHPSLRRWTRHRKAAYLDAGWLPPGLDPVVARVERFLASRPRSRRAT
jgi:hypothetical protein